eukprot:TRINITY_DN13379_c0_g1_i1.p1 TRINITY_DN13379_c0_g1~~TRINITY_DN13379_c0_g1_i1.p1  ORF type:complete len:239 (-),score=30.38 TRINITY_DN13379_c0_g1_i1:289-1005(-)
MMKATSTISSFNDDGTACSARQQVWKMFFEPGASVAKLGRCSIELASCCVPKASSEQGNISRFDDLPLSSAKSRGSDANRDVELLHGAATPPSLNLDIAAAPDVAFVEPTDTPISEALRPSDTTVLVRHIPCKVGYKRMMLELKSLGLDGCYDFLYLPKSRRDRHSNRGFCFVNFTSLDAVTHFSTKFANYQFADIQSQKLACVGRASVQGLKANVARLISVSNRVEFKTDAVGLRAS